MNPDQNWKETRLLTQDLNQLLNLPENISEDFLKILENLIIHRFLEITLSPDFNKGDTCSIELPYLGTLVISTKTFSTDFVVRNSFYRKLRNAYNTKQSPLVTQCAKILGKSLVEKFELDQLGEDNNE